MALAHLSWIPKDSSAPKKRIMNPGPRTYEQDLQRRCKKEDSMALSVIDFLRTTKDKECLIALAELNDECLPKNPGKLNGKRLSVPGFFFLVFHV